MTSADLVSLLGPPDDVVYVHAPPRRRRALLRRLRAEGLRPAASFVHAAGDETLVELDRRALVFATRTLLPAPRWMQLAAAASARPVLHAAERLLPRVGVACRRPSGEPVAAWLGDRPREGAHGLVLHRSHSGHRFVYALGERPRFAKVDADERERAVLERHAPLAARAGAIVPELVDSTGEALVTTLVPGRAASSALAAGGVAPEEVVRRIAAWLAEWNRLTQSPAVVTRELLETEIFSPLDSLGGFDDYRSALARRSERWLGSELPLVTAHLDLTTSNVLLGSRGIAVVDWAEARADTLPLVDLYYAAADAAAAVDSYRDRAGALGDGRYARLVREPEQQLAAALQIADDVRELCFHACWLHHAANEHRRGGAGPFRRIVEHVSRQVTGD